MKQPLVSIIIPMYNSEKTIEKCLISVLNQTYKNLEIIVINDGSIDKSLDIVKRIKTENPNRTINIINQKNGGVSSARNSGLKIVKGKYCAFLDSDDEWSSQKIEICVYIMESNSEFELIGHAYTLKSDVDINSINLDFEKKEVKEYRFFDILLRNRFVTSSFFFRTKSKIYFDEKMKYSEDHEFLLRFSSNGKIGYINFPLIKRNRPLLSKGGLSSNKIAMRIGEIRMYIASVRYRKEVLFILPFMVVYSFLKHFYKALLQRLSKCK